MSLRIRFENIACEVRVKTVAAAGDFAELRISWIDVFDDREPRSQVGGKVENRRQRDSFAYEKVMNKCQHQNVVETSTCAIEERSTLLVKPAASSGRPCNVDDQRQDVQP